ncbi:amidohydrolase [Alcaligenes parafaecalis]|uniref:Amidohydrolase n=1 Tax=Alcaligenes parafaecalis TaxID=171260 RepID=A0ABT3VHU6_9BURK|nr:amidohydrolase [Alcaligenes parafaecalis]MCX5463053.1 amidohydrolase [Alcaligenes parafaecalis]
MYFPRLRAAMTPLMCLAGLCAVSPIAFAAPPAADLLIVNGRIYTQSPAHAWVEALAIRDGKIEALGSTEQLQARRGEQTKLIDLGGKMAMPGINEAHSHPVWGGLKHLFQCNFPFTVTPDVLADTLKACVARSETLWIQGGQWDSDFFKTHKIDSPRQWLDAVSGDKAIVLTDDTGHNAWVNSKALGLLQIDTNFTPPSGMTVKHEVSSREPNGVLVEANSYIRSFVPDWTDEQYLKAAQYAVQESNQFGITGLKDADASEAVVRAYYNLDKHTGLNAHVATAIRISGKESKHVFDFAEIDRISKQYARPNLKTNYVKIYTDGVPTAAHTAAMLEPYVDTHHDDPLALGALVVPENELDRVVTHLDGAGYGLKLHTAGDRAIRIALNAIEKARKANGASGMMHELAHSEFVDSQDQPRFRALNVAADFSPYIWYPSGLIDAISSVVGERSKNMFQARSLLDQNVTIVAGSDWPSGVKNNNPWPAIEALITRANPFGQRTGEQLGAEQALNLNEALQIFTKDGAKALGRETETGSLEIGKSADLIVLDRDLFKIEPNEISDTKVIMTIFQGRLVHPSSK